MIIWRLKNQSFFDNDEFHEKLTCRIFCDVLNYVNWKSLIASFECIIFWILNLTIFDFEIRVFFIVDFLKINFVANFVKILTKRNLFVSTRFVIILLMYLNLCAYFKIIIWMFLFRNHVINKNDWWKLKKKQIKWCCNEIWVRDLNFQWLNLWNFNWI